MNEVASSSTQPIAIEEPDWLMTDFQAHAFMAYTNWALPYTVWALA